MNAETPENTGLPASKPQRDPEVQARRAKRAAAGGGGPGKNGPGKRKKPAPKPKAAQPIYIQPPVPKAKMKKRHWGLILSFILFVIAPSSFVGWYLWERAAPRYVSYVGFSVRREEVASASELLGNIAAFSGSSSSDTTILYNFIQSQEMIRLVEDKLDLRAIWSKGNPDVDPVFAYHAPGSIEDLTKYWARMVKVYSDDGSGLIDMTVQAFAPEDATKIAEMIYEESSVMINRLSTISREDALGYARDELNVALENLRKARQQITRFRNRTQIVDPSANIQSQMGLLGSLETQSADVLIDLDILLQTSSETDPRVVTAQRRLDAINARIVEERKKLGFAGSEAGDGDSGFADIVDEYESLSIDLTFAEETYAVTRAAYAAAVAEARRQKRYLAAHVRPTTAETSEYPRRYAMLGLFGLFAFMLWTLIVLISYAIKDRR